MADDVMQLKKKQEAEAAVVDGGITSPAAAAHGNSECGTTEKISICLMDIDQDSDQDSDQDTTTSSSSSSSSGKRCRVLTTGTIVSVFERTAPCIRGSHATSYTARVKKNLSEGQEWYYIVAPTVESRQKPRKVPEYAVQEQKSFMSDTNQRKRGQMSSQQRKEKNKNRQDIAFLETELIKVGKEKEKLQKKHNMTLEENKTMKEERAALLSLVRGDKGQQQ